MLAEHPREEAAARERLDAAIARQDELSDEECEQAEADIDLVHGRHSIDGHKLRKQLARPAAADPDEAGQQVVDDNLAAAAA